MSLKDDEQELHRVRTLLELAQGAEQRVKNRNMRAALALSAARCQLATAVTMLEDGYTVKMRAVFDQAKAAANAQPQIQQ